MTPESMVPSRSLEEEYGFMLRFQSKAEDKSNGKVQASEFKVEERGTAWLCAPASGLRETFEVCLKSTIFWLLLSLTDGAKVK